MKIRKIIEVLDKKMFESGDIYPIGLAEGKMGHCIYFFYINKMFNNNEYEKNAESSLDRVFDQLKMIKIYDIKDGLAGIGLGIDYLVKNKYVKGNINNIIEDVDNVLFKQICNPDNLNNNDISLQLQLIYYFTIRLKEQKKHSENEYLFRESIINAINFISDKLYPYFFDESLSFNMENFSILPLLVLNQCDELYSSKINRILKEISFCALSKIPTLHANRLYLLYTMDKINKKINVKGWDEHIALLARESDVEYVIENELADNIYFFNGLSAIYYLLSDMAVFFTSSQINKYKRMIINKIENSPIWSKLIDDENYLKKKSGLFSGYTGTSIILQKHYNYENRFH